MYVPKINEMADFHEITDFMKRFSFGTIISVQDNIPVATHLPFLVTTSDNGIKVYSHFAKANPQWKEIGTGKVLVIFNEPHAYISPANYEHVLNVPTWNYIAVHVYGQAKIIEDEKEVLNILEHTIDFYEETYKNQWNELPQSFKEKMIKGIVAFEINITDVQAKKKLSQNKTKQEQEKIIDTLSKSTNSSDKLIADYMNEML